ncbi:MAG: DUF5134 domain-containing protein [Pseudonocardiaceae bacterium]
MARAVPSIRPNCRELRDFRCRLFLYQGLEVAGRDRLGGPGPTHDRVGVGMALGVLWLDVPLAVACLLAAVHHVGLLVVLRVPFVPAASHGVMGVGMAAMFVPVFDPVPRLAWVVIFLLVGAWFGAAALHAGSLLGDAGHLTVGAVAMLFMLVRHAQGSTGPDGPVDPGHAGHAGAAAGVPGLLLTVVAIGFAVWFIADIVRRLVGPDGTDSPATPVAHRVARLAAPLVMSAAMAVMLLGMA